MRNLHVRVHQRVATGVEGGVTGVWCKDPDSRKDYTENNDVSVLFWESKIIANCGILTLKTKN